jgi:hypothetical protein
VPPTEPLRLDELGSMARPSLTSAAPRSKPREIGQRGPKRPLLCLKRGHLVRERETASRNRIHPSPPPSSSKPEDGVRSRPPSKFGMVHCKHEVVDASSRSDPIAASLKSSYGLPASTDP